MKRTEIMTRLSFNTRPMMKALAAAARTVYFIAMEREAGVSRSAAVTLWAWERLGLVIRPADVHRHNRYVYRLLREVEER